MDESLPGADRDPPAEGPRAAEQIRAERERFRVTLSSIGDAVIATDIEARVTFLNPVAETLTRWKTADALGRPLSEVFHIVNETTRQPAESPALRALRERGVHHDVALVGFDDIVLADLLEPAVTVVAQDPRAIGELAAERLFARLSGDGTPERVYTVPTTLITRGSGEIAPRR